MTGGMNRQMGVGTVTLPARHVRARDVFLLMNVLMLLHLLLGQRVRFQTCRTTGQRFAQNIVVELFLTGLTHLITTLASL